MGEDETGIAKSALPTGEALTAGFGALGDLLAANGMLPEALAVKAAAPLLSYSASRGWVWAGRQFERVAEFVERVQQRRVETGAAPSPDVADLVEEAVPLIANTASYTKRQLLEAVVLKAVGDPARAKEQSRNSDALRLINQLSETALILLATMVEMRCAQKEGVAVFADPAGIERFRADAAMEELVNTSPQLVMAMWSKGHRGPNGVTPNDGFFVREAGYWLIQWVADNPEEDETRPDLQE